MVRGIDPSEVLAAAGLEPNEVQVMDGLSLDDIAAEDRTSLAGGLSSVDTVGIPAAVETADGKAEVIPTIESGIGRTRVIDASKEHVNGLQHKDVITAKNIQDAIDKGDLEDALRLYDLIHNEETALIMLTTLEASTEKFIKTVLDAEDQDGIARTGRFESARARISRISIDSVRESMLDLVDSIESAAIINSSETLQIKVLMALRLGNPDKIKNTLIEIAVSTVDLSVKSESYASYMRSVLRVFEPFGITEVASEEFIRTTKSLNAINRKVNFTELIRKVSTDKYGRKP